jgi:hypothetical protein
MNLALKDGGVSLTVQLGTGKLDTAIKPASVRFDDNAWHHVLVVRKSSEVSGETDSTGQITRVLLHAWSFFLAIYMHAHVHLYLWVTVCRSAGFLVAQFLNCKTLLKGRLGCKTRQHAWKMRV